MRLQFFFTRQRKQKGLGDAILCGQHFTGSQPFVVALGDSILGLNGSSRVVSDMIEVYHRKKAACVIATEVVPRESVSSYGIVEPEGDGIVYSIRNLVEKPSPEEAPSNLAIAARYVFSPAIYEAINQTRPGKQGEIQLTDAIRLLLENGEKVVGVRLPTDQHRYDIGNYKSYFQAFIDFALHDDELGLELENYLKDKLGEDR